MRLPLLGNRSFVKLWLGATVSSAGSQISALAIPLTAILTLKASAFDVALLIALKYLPLAVFGIPAGAVVDRASRRRLLVVCDMSRAVILGSVPAALAIHSLGMPLLYAAAIGSGVFDVLFDVAHPAYLVNLVDRTLLVDANARLQLSEQGASTAGPALASLLISWIGAPMAVGVDAASFAASAVFLLAIRAAEPAPKPPERTALAAEVLAGIGFIARHHGLRALVLSSSISNLFLRMLSAVVLIRLARDVGLSPLVIGIVLSVGEAGFLVGSLIAARVRRRFGLVNTFTVAAVLASVTGLPIALAPPPVAAQVTALGLFTYGLAAVVWTINAAAFRQTVTPQAILGRVGAAGRVASWGTIPIASVVAGAAAAKWGAQAAMVIGAAGALAGPVPIVVWRIRHRTLEQVEPQAAVG